MANGYSEENDRLRFKDYYKSSRSKKRSLQNKAATGQSFKKYDRHTMHNMNRITSISEVLEEQSSTGFFNKERGESHHNLDYYGCF